MLPDGQQLKICGLFLTCVFWGEGKEWDSSWVHFAILVAEYYAYSFIVGHSIMCCSLVSLECNFLYSWILIDAKLWNPWNQVFKSAFINPNIILRLCNKLWTRKHVIGHNSFVIEPLTKPYVMEADFSFWFHSLNQFQYAPISQKQLWLPKHQFCHPEKIHFLANS